MEFSLSNDNLGSLSTHPYLQSLKKSPKKCVEILSRDSERNSHYQKIFGERCLHDPINNRWKSREITKKIFRHFVSGFWEKITVRPQTLGFLVSGPDLQALKNIGPVKKAKIFRTFLASSFLLGAPFVMTQNDLRPPKKNFFVFLQRGPPVKRRRQTLRKRQKKFFLQRGPQ